MWNAYITNYNNNNNNNFASYLITKAINFILYGVQVDEGKERQCWYGSYEVVRRGVSTAASVMRFRFHL